MKNLKASSTISQQATTNLSTLLIDNGSSLNVMPKTTLDTQLASTLKTSSVVVRAVDGPKREVIGEITLPIRIRPTTFDITFQYVEGDEEALETSFQVLEIVGTTNTEAEEGGTGQGIRRHSRANSASRELGKIQTQLYRDCKRRKTRAENSRQEVDTTRPLDQSVVIEDQLPKLEELSSPRIRSWTIGRPKLYSNWSPRKCK
ncbi:hypothetical protein CR513_48481, partial [Mucuna pruriens]